MPSEGGRERPPLIDPALGALTRDPILRGALTLYQPARGYRFTVDPLLLSAFMAESARRPRGALQLCDLGAGSGVLGLSLLRAIPSAHLVAVEVQPRLAGVARRNVDENGLSERAEVVELDLAEPRQARRLGGARFDWVVSNPPYQALGRGATNPDPESAIARHELRLPLARLCAELRRLLKPGGQAGLIYPANRLDELLASLAAVELSPRRLRSIHPRPGEPATRVLLLCDKVQKTGRLEIAAPLVERDADGRPSAELERITAGEGGRVHGGNP